MQYVTIQTQFFHNSKFWIPKHARKARLGFKIINDPDGGLHGGLQEGHK